MGKAGGNRNFGYGKTLAWAGKNALLDRYGQGHFSTRATHQERWCQFVRHLKSEQINDARNITMTVINRYGKQLNEQVKAKTISVAYAQNLLSTVNVVLEALRKDNLLQTKPAYTVGQRSHVRSGIPVTINPSALNKPLLQLQQHGQARTAFIAQLTRSLGLRFKEASILDIKKAIKQANRSGRINITEGTKGGRGKGADRWVPVNEKQLKLLKQAAQLQDKQKNLIPTNKSYSQWRDQVYYQWTTANKATDIKGFHDMRAAYACERYQTLTGFPAPVITGQRQANKALDTKARTILSQELGHNRIDVIAAYIGSSK